jgi:hypothetical protein
VTKSRRARGRASDPGGGRGGMSVPFDTLKLARQFEAAGFLRRGGRP